MSPSLTLSPRSTDLARQLLANFNFALAYNLLILLILILLSFRNLFLQFGRRRRRSQLVEEKNQFGWGGVEGDWREKERREESGKMIRKESGWMRVERWMTKPIGERWEKWGMENRAQVAVVVGVVLVTIPFCLAVSLDVRGSQSILVNTSHQVALRCGLMSLANAPAIFALTGRNSMAEQLTGIEYGKLRFAHKVFGINCCVLGLIHTVGATLTARHFEASKGVLALYKSQLGVTGVVMVVGCLLMMVFMVRSLRARAYEVFLVAHIVGAVSILVGMYFHVPALRIWVYIPLAFWGWERLARIVRYVSARVRSPIIRANASLVDGAIVLRVPYKGEWHAGQHCYLSFFFSSRHYGQAHPFSIANVPTTPTSGSLSTKNEMLFVLRQRDGVTGSLAAYLEQFSSSTADIRVCVEGPYGAPIDVEQYDEMLLVAGGSGITHMASMMAEAVQKAKTSVSRTRRIRLVWTIQSLAQTNWIMTELLDTLKAAEEVGIELIYDFHVTRGSLDCPAPETRNTSRNNSFDSLDSLYKPRVSMHGRKSLSLSGFDLSLLLSEMDPARTHKGRPKLFEIVPDFIEFAEGSTLVAVCGPAAIAKKVTTEVEKLAGQYPVSLNVAVFEC